MDLVHVSVRDGATLYTRVLYLAALTLSIVSSQKCTTATLDPRNVSNYDSSRLVPLRGREAETRCHNAFSEQWIFPDLQITCRGLLTKWIFIGVPGRAFGSCTVELETWRLDTTITITVYDRISTTERNIVTITQDGPIFIYDLASPVVVEPGDVVGVELEYLCIESEDYDNVLSFNISGTGSTYSSYRQAGSESTFYLEPFYCGTPEQDLIPLIDAVVEPFQGFTRSDIKTLSATERVLTGPEADQSESGGSLVTTITAATVGVFIGVLITVIVCICVWCIIRRVRHKKERQTSVANKRQEQEDGSTPNVISMQQNEAYAEPTVCHTAIGIPEQEVQQLNRVCRVRGEGCVEIDAEETGDEYQRMYAANRHVMFRPNARELEKCLNFAKPRVYDLPVQQREGNVYTGDNEHPYEYI